MPTKTLFLILAPRPLSTRLGAFLFPETFSCKFFPKFFPPKGRRTFFYFYGAKNYGGKGLFSPQNRGGCPSFMPFLHIAKGLPSCLPSSSPVVNFQPIGANFRQKVAKVNIYLLALVFSRYFWRQQTAKSKHIFGKWCECVVSCVPLVEVFHYVHRVQVVRSCSFSLGVFRPFALPLSLSCFVCGALPFKYALISRFKGVLEGFGVRMYVCMGLVLCLDCVAFVRVWS